MNSRNPSRALPLPLVVVSERLAVLLGADRLFNKITKFKSDAFSMLHWQPMADGLHKLVAVLDPMGLRLVYIISKRFQKLISINY